MFLKDLRKSLGLTQGQLAEALGVSCSCICKYEKGVSKMPASFVSKVETLYCIIVEQSLSQVEQLKVEKKELNRQLGEVSYELYLANLRMRNLKKDVYKLYQQLGDFIKRMEEKDNDK